VPEPCVNKSIRTNILYRRRTAERRVLTLLAALPAMLLAGVLSVPVPPFTAVVLPDEAIVAFWSKNYFNGFEIGYDRWLWKDENER
jgi:hypothetical protein